jgi:copper chaperone CopZ
MHGRGEENLMGGGEEMRTGKGFFAGIFLVLFLVPQFNTIVFAAEKVVKISVLAFNTSTGIREILEDVKGVNNVEIPRDPDNMDMIRGQWYKAIITYDDATTSLEKIKEVLMSQGHDVVGKDEFLK